MNKIAEISTPSCATAVSSVEYSALSGAEQEKLLQLQQDLLESVAQGGESAALVNRICKLAEQSLPNSIGSVMLVDKGTELLNVYAAPSVPAEGVARLNGLQPGPGGGSCGNAVFRKAPQFIDNTFTDPRWENMREIAKDFNLCACWSMPIFSTQGNVLGSFALSSFEHRSPSNFHRKLLEIGASVIGILLDRRVAA
jgi:GAF domain-containing protein